MKLTLISWFVANIFVNYYKDCVCLKISNYTFRMHKLALNEWDCTLNTWLEFGGSEELRDACGCQPRCSETGYKYTITESRWPAPKFYKSFSRKEILGRSDRQELKAYRLLREVITENENSSAEDSNYDFINYNFARLNVYLRDLESLHTEQQVAYPLSNLFSDIGGSLGLWVGLSLLTLVELLQLLVRMSLVICGKAME